MDRKTVVYTCITNSYDWLLPPLGDFKDVDFVCFTDSYRECKGRWLIKPVPRKISNFEGGMVNRYMKLFPHEFLSEYEWSIYIDGNIRIMSDFSHLIDEMEQEGYIIGCPAHPDRSTILEEVPFCKIRNKFPASDLAVADTQLEDYRKEGMPFSQPLTENNFIIRKHADARVKGLMYNWWSHLQKYTKRDQISFPYVVWRSGIQLKMFSFAGSVKNPYIRKVAHRNKRSRLQDITSYTSARSIDSVLWKILDFITQVSARLIRGLHLKKYSCKLLAPRR